MDDRPVAAAGAVVWRSVQRRLQVLLVHRPKYDDWTFPKGKLDGGESAPVAAVREVEEETGVRIRLGARLLRHEYRLTREPGGVKQVTYWCARPVDKAAGEAAERYRPNQEIGAVRWLEVDDAAEQLTYARDTAVLDEFDRAVRADLHRAAPLVVLRHAEAEPRKGWGGPDRERPLSAAGRTQAERLAPLLATFDPTAVVSSDMDRCVQTVEPLCAAGATTSAITPKLRKALSETGATRGRVRDLVDPLVERRRRAVLCTHRPVLPWVFEALGLPAPRLSAGELVVVHHRHGRVLGSEVLSP